MATSLTAAQKIARILVDIDTATVTDLTHFLTDDEMDTISAAIDDILKIDYDLSTTTLEEFHKNLLKTCNYNHPNTHQKELA